jgi:phosphodiesterase/alkaline phosphatase D-like protein
MKRWRMTMLITLVAYAAFAASAWAATPPTVTTEPASPVGDTTATLKGTIDPNGETTLYHFEWGLSTSYGAMTPGGAMKAGTKTESVSAAVTGLEPDTTYHYRLDAGSASGTTYGADHTFHTGGSPQPVVTTGPASGVTTTGATVTAQIATSTEATSWYVEYGTSTNYSAQSIAQMLAPSSTAQTVSVALNGLAPFTVFHYRFVAMHGSLPPEYGADATFQTYPAPPPTPRVTASTTPHRSHRSHHRPYAFTTNGRIIGPSTESSLQICGGDATVSFWLGRKRLSSTNDPVQLNCTFFNQTSFSRLPGHGRKGRTVKLKVEVRYNGDGWVGVASARSETVTLS